ncbi:hypothetical protein S7711_09427 [Stachybotrys chartarum IBT 7711]|uniref:HpcH/HpaI aldolase/citrate lyase domain-containing protein n=1 Tax=Stachybotrys chartarum (strain CBS 109288 / IBT 7711) TaxID=1280523 RepID=A0A084AL83_STACB|nr:hypothetical protein S7711_09427 [Stachybotrys chartarum IBT 7711]
MTLCDSIYSEQDGRRPNVDSTDAPYRPTQSVSIEDHDDPETVTRRISVATDTPSLLPQAEVEEAVVFIPRFSSMTFAWMVRRLLEPTRTPAIEFDENGPYGHLLQNRNHTDPATVSLPAKDYIVHLSHVADFHLRNSFVFFDHTEFLKQLNLTFPRLLHVGSPSWPTLLLLVIATGKLFLEKAPRGSGPPGFENFLQSVDLLPTAIELGKDPRTAIETICLLTFYSQAVGLHNLAYLYAGHAARLLRSSRLHRQGLFGCNSQITIGHAKARATDVQNPPAVSLPFPFIHLKRDCHVGIINIAKPVLFHIAQGCLAQTDPFASAEASLGPLFGTFRTIVNAASLGLNVLSVVQDEGLLDVVEVRALRGLREECPPPSEARHSTELTEQTTSELQNVGSCMGNSIRQPDDVYLEDDIANNPMSFDFEDLQCRLAEGRLCTAIGVKFIANNELVLLAKAAGYDTIFVDLEHSNFSIPEAHTLCSAALLAGITPFVRVPYQCGSGLVQRLLDGGAMGIIFPHISTVEEAENSVAFMKFPPSGKRSLTAALPHFAYQRVGAKTVMEQLDSLGSTVFIMIETIECLENIDDIAAVDGVDVLLLGANDLSLELGILGEWEHARFQAAMRAIASAAKKFGKVFGVAGLYSRPDICRRAVAELGASSDSENTRVSDSLKLTFGSVSTPYYQCLELDDMAFQHNIVRLRTALKRTASPAIAMAAHNPLAAKLAAEAGFDAIWVSGFELSASYAVPDASILPMSAILEMTRAMGEVQDLPLVVDLDTGFGNAINVAYAVPRFAAAGAAAVVLEDKMFPKESSLRAGGRHTLVSVEEFRGKIAAAKAASPVLVIARTEALIAGLGEKEALHRGIAYADAGADAILIHSKQKTPDEIMSFAGNWSGDVPLVIVPTSYPQLSFRQIGELDKVGLIICGNHAIRAAVTGMRDTFRNIVAGGSIAQVEDKITPVKEIFKLQGDDSMRVIEKLYLH